MSSINQSKLRLLIALTCACTFGSEHFAWLECSAQNKQTEVSQTKKSIYVSEVKFDLGSIEANQFVAHTTKIKPGSVFNRESIARDLGLVFSALRRYWKSREAHTDWLRKLQAEPTLTRDAGIKLTISVAPFFSTNKSLRKSDSNSQTMTAIIQEVTPPFLPKTPQWNHKERDDSCCRLGGTKDQRDRDLKDWLDEKTHCYPGYDSETNF